MTVLVVGGGFAGTAAAWELTRLGAEVAMVWDRGGASELYSGALDEVAGAEAEGEVVRHEVPPLAEAAEFLQALGAWLPEPCRVATSAGLVRAARARDRAVLDLEPLRGSAVAVVDLGRPGWDAELLASACAASAWARASGTRFAPVPVEPPSVTEVRLLSDFDLSARFDEPAWQAAFLKALAAVGSEFAAYLLGPWLGHAPASAARLGQACPRPLGEALSEPGGAAGVRFGAVRDAWLARARVGVWRGRLCSLEPTSEGWRASWQPEAEDIAQPFASPFSAVVLALGGVLGGGIRYAVGPRSAAEGAFTLSLDAPLELKLDGRDVRLLGGAEGVDLVALGMGALERVGIDAPDYRVARQPSLLAAGDVVAARPRTALEAVRAGIRAARTCVAG